MTYFNTCQWFVYCADCGVKLRATKELRVDVAYYCESCLKIHTDNMVKSLLDSDGHGGKFIAIVDSY